MSSRKQDTKLKCLIILTIVLLVLLVILIVVALMLPKGEAPAAEDQEPIAVTEDTGQPIPEQTEESTLPTETEQPTEQTAPSVEETETPETQAPTSAGSNGGGSGSSSGGKKPSSSGGKKPSTSKKEEGVVETKTGELTCSEFSLFSGQYVEDGRDELVKNVATILVTNNTDRFLDMATLYFTIDGRDATFMVTGLPAGKSVWVLETSKLTATNSSTFEYLEYAASFRDDVATSSSKISISADGNMLTAKNNTDQKIENVVVYYKKLHTDGNFFGGITYVVDFGTLEPGQSVETLAGHYDGTRTEIVRIAWQNG